MFNDNGSFLLALFEFFLFFAWFMCLFWIFGDLFRSKDLGGGAKTFWVLFVIFLPILGILVYLIARGRACRTRDWQARPRPRSTRRSTSSRWPPTSGLRARRRSDRVGQGVARHRRDHQSEFEQLKAKALAIPTPR